MGRYTRKYKVSDFPRLPSGKISKKFQNLIGTRSGKLLVESFWGREKGNYWWNCKCDCGNYHVADSRAIKINRSTHCGCNFKSKNLNVKNHYTYETWKQMNKRCNDPKHKSFDHYHNILKATVCWDWHEDNFHGFTNFYNWCQENPRPEEYYESGKCKYSLDRIQNVGGNYSPENCRWSTNVEQMENTRVYHGEIHTHTWKTWQSKNNRNLFCDEWREYQNFKNDVIEVPENKYLSRRDVSQPFGPDNFIFTDKCQKPNKTNRHFWNLFLEK